MLRNPVVIVPAFKREESLERLLSSLLAADLGACPGVIISLEGGASQTVVAVANDFASRSSLFEVRQQPTNLGLRNHILACGDCALEYGSVIVLEDDLWVDRHFYSYAVAALEFYEGHSEIAGCALYAPGLNEYLGLPFSPMNNGHSTYLMQVPCSWGQVWTADQWQDFRNWYDQASEQDIQALQRLPQNVKDWPESSWKKYFAAYMVLTDRNFIYPYHAYSTSCCDPDGTHIPTGSNRFQVPLSAQQRPLEPLRFCPADDDLVAYDAFFEAAGSSVFEDLGMDRQEIEIDAYGLKPIELLQTKQYAITSRPVLKQTIRQSYPLVFRPVEANLGFRTGGFHQGELHVVESAHLRDAESSPSLHQLSYFFGFNMQSLRHLQKILKALPGVLVSRIKGHFNRR
jgi:hypothetical protein